MRCKALFSLLRSEYCGEDGDKNHETTNERTTPVAAQGWIGAPQWTDKRIVHS